MDHGSLRTGATAQELEHAIMFGGQRVCSATGVACFKERARGTTDQQQDSLAIATAWRVGARQRAAQRALTATVDNADAHTSADQAACPAPCTRRPKWLLHATVIGATFKQLCAPATPRVAAILSAHIATERKAGLRGNAEMPEGAGRGFGTGQEHHESERQVLPRFWPGAREVGRQRRG